jgi:ABC-type amino acid transport substrate-binding protein
MQGLRTWLVMGAMCATPAAVGAEELKLLTTLVPGLIEQVDPMGEFTGPGAQTLQRLMQEARQPYQLQAAPLARSLLDAKAAPWTCAVGAVRQPATESQYAWIGPLSRTHLVAMTRLDDARVLETPADLKGLRILVARAAVADGVATELGLTISRISNDTVAYRMLQHGRADVWLASELVVNRVLGQESGAPLRRAMSLRSIEHFLACHPGLPAADLKRLNAAAAALRARGDLAQYGLR